MEAVLANNAEAFFQIGGIGLVVYIVCNFALRRYLAPDSDVFEQIFDRPIFGTITRAPMHIKTKYFIPWVPSPEYLHKESLWVKTLFWGARLGGTVLAVGIAAFLLSAIYIATNG